MDQARKVIHSSRYWSTVVSGRVGRAFIIWTQRQYDKLEVEFFVIAGPGVVEVSFVEAA